MLFADEALLTLLRFTKGALPMVSQPQKDTPFGLEPNLAAGLAYLLSIIGGVVMLAGGGTNRFVRFAACQSITFFLAWVVIRVASGVLAMFLHFLWLFLIPLYLVIGLVFFVAWIYLWINAFQGKEVRLPIIGDLTQSLFGTMLAA